MNGLACICVALGLVESLAFFDEVSGAIHGALPSTEPLLTSLEPRNGLMSVSHELKQLMLRFDESRPIKKGNGHIQIFQSKSHSLWQNISVQSSQVTVDDKGSSVEVKLNRRLGPRAFLMQFYVLVQDGAIVSNATNEMWPGIVHPPKSDGTHKHRVFSSWSFTIEPDTVIPANTLTTNKSTTPFYLEVWGVGIFVSDVGAIDLKRGTFYADFQLYLLKYYRKFKDQDDALLEATLEEPDEPDAFAGPGKGQGKLRACNWQGDDAGHWLFLSNLTGSQVRLTNDKQRMLERMCGKIVMKSGYTSSLLASANCCMLGVGDRAASLHQHRQGAENDARYETSSD
jgi:hypothetical protein